MKISRVSFLMCYFMHYKTAIVGCILSLIFAFCTGEKGLTFLLLGFVTILINVWINTTNLFEAGADHKAVSKMLVHSESSFTEKVYNHLRGDGYDQMYEAIMQFAQ